jgi:hypothetical protein
MKRWLVGLSLVLGVFFITPAPVAHAWSWSGWWSSFNGKSSAKKNHYKKKTPHERSHHKGKHPKGNAVPELDPSAAGSAMVLLLGGIAVLSRRGKKREPSFLA